MKRLRSHLLVAGLLCAVVWAGARAQPPHEDGSGNFHVPAADLPPSSLLSGETKSILKQENQEQVARLKQPSCGNILNATAGQVPAFRKCELAKFLSSEDYARLNKLYPVRLSPGTIAGVYTEVFTPATGIAPENRHRVLINVHGGGFLIGTRTFSKVESMPVAATGRIEVISIDYRLAPEYKFPAASEDVEAVYRELLTRYKPHEIGVYGCSAGGLLVAESIARFIKDKLPLPGAVGMFCEGGAYHMQGDSGQPYVGVPVWHMKDNPYFAGVDASDPLAFPVRSSETLAKFPPSLLISATRDFALSATVNTHSKLVAQGVDAELHVWEGLGHGFFYDPRLPESREAYDVIVKFFEKHLAR